MNPRRTAAAARQQRLLARAGLADADAIHSLEDLRAELSRTQLGLVRLARQLVLARHIIARAQRHATGRHA